MSFLIGLGLGIVIGALLTRTNELILWYERKKSERLERNSLDLTKRRLR